MSRYPPKVNVGDKVILFDGVCKLCNRWSQFIIAFDHEKKFKLCSVQSLEGKAILDHFGLSTEVFDTMLLVEDDICYKQSDAFLRVVADLQFPWKALSVFKFIPRPIRNWAYDRIALNRYALFGRYDRCVLPTPDHEQRFLHGIK